MGLLYLEALGAGLVLVLIVWWTMFHGRVKGELPSAHTPEPKTCRHRKKVVEISPQAPDRPAQ